MSTIHGVYMAEMCKGKFIIKTLPGMRVSQIYRRFYCKFRVPIAIPLPAIARNCAQLSELRAIVMSLQGSQLRASKIHLRWKP